MAFAVAGFQTFVYSAEPEDHWKAGLVASFGGTFVSAKTHTIDQLRERSATSTWRTRRRGTRG